MVLSAEEKASIFAFKSISSVEEAEEAIESAEESRDLNKLLFIIAETTRHGGSEEAEEWEASAEAVLDAFYRVAKGGKTAPGTSLTILWKKLRRWISCEAIVEVCLGCIVYAAKSVDETAIKLIDANLLITIMQKYEEESTIQEQACLAIESMALSSAILKKKLLVPYCIGMKEELIAAKGRIRNERNKKYPGLAAVALGIEL